MDTSTRLKGHGLFAEGQPFEWAGADEGEPYPAVARSWTGPARCTCGAESPVLESNNARKRWHKQHKEEIRAGLPSSVSHSPKD